MRDGSRSDAAADRRRRLTAVVSAGCAAFSLAACAGAPPPPPLPDQPGDQGFVPRGQQIFISPMGEPFRADRDAPYPVAAWFAQADADHDGRLTLAEFQAQAERFFQRLDQNHDGIIDGLEVQAYERDIAPEILPSIGRLRSGEGQDENLGRPHAGRRAGRGVDGQPQGGRDKRIQAGDRSAEGAGLYGFFQEPEPVSSADADFDGRITLGEWRAKAARAFKRLDKGDLGYLTLATLPKTPQQEIDEKHKAARAKRGGG